MTFAVARLRRRKSPSGMSGSATRDSMATNTAKMAIAAAVRPTV